MVTHIGLQQFVYASIPATHKEAYNFLRSIGEDDIIKNEVVVLGLAEPRQIRLVRSLMIAANEINRYRLNRVIDDVEGLFCSVSNETGN